ncbi:DUF1569 domain-containing protein [Flagellimonas taeanensis]|uniref:DUF1569 domain-containing protein n=1 Tax=Flavobacteriaceae TaxID=49546 RepID=UPI000E69C23C|nr:MULTISPECIES: DUF1569 domain-containing protein [Allomuricauda]MDC6385974.1 DUF1569 domain-containing protein [Muricauda sp. SK9]RIV50217.1 DUF1569 domain-containing protein [Allomuricauda taeanensis]
MKSLFNTEVHTEILARTNQLTESSHGLWGKMTVGQMLCHCQFPLKIALGDHGNFKKVNPLMKLLMKSFKKSMYDDKPWRHNLPTAKDLKVADDKDFSTEKKKLIKLIEDFHQQKDKKVWDPHPVFGSFTYDQWGQMQYKHLDHHLRQFGV